MWYQRGWRRKWQPNPVFLPGESPWTGAWRATVHGVARVGHDLVTTPPPPPLPPKKKIQKLQKYFFLVLLEYIYVKLDFLQYTLTKITF